MKFSLFEFINAGGCNSFNINESCWIVDFEDQCANNTDFDFDEEILVNWPAGGDKRKSAQIHTAKVYRFQVCSS